MSRKTTPPRQAASATAGAAVGQDAALFPPYGDVPAEWAFDMQTRQLPAGLREDRAGGAGLSESAWSGLVQQLVEDMAEHLWPRWVDGTGWSGQAARTAVALTRADLALMPALREHLYRPPEKLAGPLLLTHQQLFVNEDVARGPIALELAPYLGAEPADQVTAIGDAAERALGTLGPSPLFFKRWQQRPRPHQAAVLLGDRGFRYERAASAASAAMISGHAIQGIVAGTAGAVMPNFRRVQPAADLLARLAAWAVDHGDRRVFAGVHYPSDNLGSWYVALQLCRHHLFGHRGAEAFRFIVKAVREHSVVHAAMRAAALTPEGEAFAPALAWLDKVMDGALPAHYDGQP
jgi:hypothetical protein